MKTTKEYYQEACSIAGKELVDVKVNEFLQRLIKKHKSLSNLPNCSTENSNLPNGSTENSNLSNCSTLQQSNLPNCPTKKSFQEQCQEIIEDLNKQAGLTYRVCRATRAMIKAVMNDGFTTEDFKHVHAVKCRQWLQDPTFRKYLRPSTLYQVKKFENYLIEWETWQRNLKKITNEKGVVEKQLDNKREKTDEELSAEKIEKILAPARNKIKMNNIIK